MNTCLVALGANIPQKENDPKATLGAAIASLAQRGLPACRISRFYRTPCFPPGTGPDYVNAAITLRSDAAPDALLADLHAVEAQFGRERVQRWGQRVLDLDLIACDQVVLPDQKTQSTWRSLPLDQQIATTPDQLILPHPRLQDRAFVLAPLADIAPNWMHPVTGHTVRAMLNALPSEARDEVSPL